MTTTTIPLRHHRLGHRRALTTYRPEFNSVLMIALAKGFYWEWVLDQGLTTDQKEIAKLEEIHYADVSDLQRLTMLAPAIVERVINGSHPREAILTWFKRNPMPRLWSEQCEILDQLERGNDE